MKENYDHLEVEPRIRARWEAHADFSPRISTNTRPFSIFLTPPNASGPMHIGNAMMIAIQDILARYHRLQGRPTLWVPSTDHGGYETQILLEKELEKNGQNRLDFRSGELFEMIEKFAQKNTETISEQIKSLGASVDWKRFRYTLDSDSIATTTCAFQKMVTDKLIYRRPYMVHYCHSCGTVLSDIELKEQEKVVPKYFVKFPFKDGNGGLVLETTRPEFIFATTHVLAHPKDRRISAHIGQQLINPSTGKTVEIVESKRKFDPTNPAPLRPFNPSFDKYDYGYTLRNNIPSQNLLDWEGKMVERHPGLSPTEAREKEVQELSEKGAIERVDENHLESIHLCKRGHTTENLITETWFLKLNDGKLSLSQNALEAIRKERLIVLPRWREKGLVEWISKMPDWPIARQNVWGIRIPVWYEMDDASKFRVWFMDSRGERRSDRLNVLIDNGYKIDEILEGLERVYADSGATWTLEREEGKVYLPETDTFDTWFSSCQWATNVYINSNYPEDLKYFYPSDSIVIGQDLLRLSVSRKLLLSQYLSGRIPFRLVYLHQLIKGEDGQKMSKSLGNAVALESYIEKYGADATRMSLSSYTSEHEDFILEEGRLELFRNFCDRLWRIGRVVDLANQNNIELSEEETLSPSDIEIIKQCETLTGEVGRNIERYSFAQAQDKICDFLTTLEEYASDMQDMSDMTTQLSVLKHVFKKYLITLHPFAPFITEELHKSLYTSSLHKN